MHHMSNAIRLVVVGTCLALAVAPGAEAKAKPGSFELDSLKLSESSVVAGETVDVSGRVQNREGRRARAARITYTLGTTKKAKNGTELDREKLKRTQGGRSRKYSQQLQIPAATGPGTYFVGVCVSPPKNECKSRELTVNATPIATTPLAPPVDTRSPSEKLRAAITAQGMLAHLQAFQEIADQNGGNRASGFQGYGASVQYVIGQLRAAGYTTTTQLFDFVVFTENVTPTFQKTAGQPPTRTYEPDDDDNANDVEFLTMNYSGSGEEEAPLTPVDVKLAEADRPNTTSGCEDSDFTAAAFEPGDIALIQRGTCGFYDKALNAQEAGASAVVIFNQGNNAGRLGVVAGTLGETAQDGDPAQPDITLPVVGTSYAIGEELAVDDTTTAPVDDVRVHVAVDADNDQRTSTNVLADTAGGNANRVVVVGSHLDSVQEGPGINDNGSGSAFNLELAIQMAKQGIEPVNRVRFAFWGAEESGLVGATRYVAALSDPALGQLAANLNFDMLASPNHGKFVYDGNFSDTPPPATAPAVNPGAARIEQEFVDYFNSQGIPTEPTAFDGRSDYKPFQDEGVAAGGLFSGAEQAKTAAQQVKWGGLAGMPFDPNYHQAGDDIDNLDLFGYEQMADGGAHVAAVLAHDPALRNVNGGRGSRGLRSMNADSTSSEWLGNRLQR